MFPQYFYLYLFAINVLTFYLYGSDKRRAVFSQRRIPEALLLALPVLGGAYGAAMGMMLFRHKTRHTSFRVTVPVCLVIWLIILMIAWLA